MILKNTTCLVTGGTGFIGSHIVDALLDQGVKKVITLDNNIRGRADNLAEAMLSKKLQMVEGDIRDISLLTKLCQGTDVIFHQAAIRITQCAQDPRLCHEIMIDGTFNVLEQCVKNHIKKIVFASTASVYGEPSYLPIDEEHPFNNTTAYGAAKIASEQEIRAFFAMYGLSYTILRYFNAYGPRMDIYGKYTEVMIRWIDALEKGESPLIHGDGTMSMDFVYVEDIARANILAVKADQSTGIYNIASQTETSLSNLAQLLIKLIQPKSKIKPIYQKTIDRPLVSRRLASIAKAKKELGFKPTVSLEEGLKSLVEWRKNVNSRTEKGRD